MTLIKTWEVIGSIHLIWSPTKDFIFYVFSWHPNIRESIGLSSNINQGVHKLAKILTDIKKKINKSSVVGMLLRKNVCIIVHMINIPFNLNKIINILLFTISQGRTTYNFIIQKMNIIKTYFKNSTSRK